MNESSNQSSTLGPYHLLKKIGEGGMGEIFLAEQREPVERRVAIKVIKKGMDTREVLARFDVEHHALSLMNHRGIARVFDAGSTPAGRPYFVMEYVPGVSVTEFCDREKVSTKQRLALFVNICSAVQHAHQKGVIHRDLKPSNILVTIADRKPVTKVIDFGVAKATAQRLTDHTLHTQAGQVIGTAEYMSPEQAEGTGIDVDTRSDVYSLGILLYQLLTGTTPFPSSRFVDVGPAEVQRIITEEDPDPPSTRLDRSKLEGDTAAGTHNTDRRTLIKRIRGDLDCIILKALAKNRTERYETVAEMADDIRRHLNGEPIHAHPPSVGYRLKKSIRRHKGKFAGAAFVLIAILAGLVANVVLYLHASDAAAEASTEKQNALDRRKELREQKAAAKKETELADQQAREAEESRELAVQHYEAIVQLADLKRLTDLEQAVDGLGTAIPENVPAMEAWLRQAQDVVGRLEQHRETLRSLRMRGKPTSGDDITSHRFDDTETQWRHDSIHKLVLGIERLFAWDILDVENRLEFARKVKQKTIDEPAQEWRKAIASISDREECPAYGGLTIEPQLGLIPLWRDESSGLWEFAHIQTGTPPARSSDGKVTLTEETGLVFVLLPGGEFLMGAEQNPPFGAEVELVDEQLRINSVDGDSLVEEAGLRAGDVVVQMNSADVTASQFQTDLESAAGGDSFEFQIRRDDQITTHTWKVPANRDPAARDLEGPIHEVSLAPYFLSKYEMTQAQWMRITKDNPSVIKPGEKIDSVEFTALTPVHAVAWNHAKNVMARVGLTLPTEAQWEYALRAGTMTPFWAGKTAKSLKGTFNIADFVFGEPMLGQDVDNYEKWLNDGWAGPSPPGTFLPNPFGLHDMLGNVQELCSDAFGSYELGVSAGSGARQSKGAILGASRGGSWLALSFITRSAMRNMLGPSVNVNDAGVRPARELSL